jgi:hypothetical protein
MASTSQFCLHPPKWLDVYNTLGRAIQVPSLYTTEEGKPMSIDLNADHQTLISQALINVNKIDLSAIRFKLSHVEHGSGWNDEKIHEAELLYRAYLSLLIVYKGSDSALAPPSLADDFWHQHILDTRKYMADCNILFGEYLHHFPYFGLRGAEDEEALRRSSTLIHGLLAKYFLPLPEFKIIAEKFSAPSDCSNCGGSCSSCKSFVAAFYPYASFDAGQRTH